MGSDDLTGQRRLRERGRGHPLAGSGTLNRLEVGISEQARKDRDRLIVADSERFDALPVELFLNGRTECANWVELAGPTRFWPAST